VARAVTLPSAILLAGAGASAAILAGAPLVGAAAVGAACWAARVAAALPRPKRRDVNPAALREPWRSLVSGAMDAENRFERAVRGTHPGPLRDRLSEVRARVAVAVDECWRIAQRGDSLQAAVAHLDPEGLWRELDQCEAELARTPGRSDVEAAAESIRRQLASAERLQAVARDARDRLRRLDAQLDEAVARAVELSLGALDPAGLQPLGSDVESVVGELESLRVALDETGRRGA
jgi:hypothetical protein